MHRSAFEKPPAESAGVGQVFRELFVAVGSLLLFREERYVIARIVRELIRVAGIEGFGRTEDGRERVGVAPCRVNSRL